VLRFCSLASGSAGNATLVEAGDGQRRTRLLIDCGLARRDLDERLARAGLAASQLDAIFITHEHGDHAGCALALSASLNIPLWMSAGTRAALPGGQAQPVHLAGDGRAIAIGGLQIQPFTVPHDAREPLQLTCTDGDRRLGVLTDLGRVTTHALASLAGCHALLLESNHCPDLLAASPYPPWLKRRIGGPHGHLSNAQAAQALTQLRHERLALVVGAHLSEHNNRPELVQAGFAQALGCAPGDVPVSSRRGLDWFNVRSRE